MGKGIGSCCYAICAILVVVISIILFLIGLALAAVGGVLIWGNSLIESFVSPIIKSLTAGVAADAVPPIDELLGEVLAIANPMATGLLISGIFLVIMGFCGMFGPCCKNKCLLFTFCLLALGILVAEMVFLITFINKKDEYVQNAGEYLKKEIKKDYTGIKSKNFITFFMNILHISLDCCGVDGGKDFVNATRWNNTFTVTVSFRGFSRQITLKHVYPVTCCKLKDNKPIDRNCSIGPTPANNNFQISCLKKVKESYVDQFSPLLSYGLGGMFGLQAIILILGILMLYHAFSSNNKVEDAARY